MAWAIEVLPSAQKELDGLDPQVRRRILRFLHERVATLPNPRIIGLAMHGPGWSRYWRYRVGDYRIVCEILDQVMTVTVVRVGHRREVYR